MAEQKNKTTIILAAILIVAVAGALTYYILAPGAPETASTPRSEQATDRPAVTEAQPARPVADLAPAEEAPLTLTALQYQPEQAQLALGVPPVSSLLANVAPLVQQIFGDEMDVSEQIALVANDLARDMGVEASDDLAVVLSAMGFDTDAGMALFLDLNEMMEEAIDAAPATNYVNLPDMSAAKGVVVIPVNDGEKAEAALQKLSSDMLAGVPTSEESAGDVVITVYEDIAAYFVTDTVLALGNDVAMLKEAAARIGAPAALRYGSASCPPDDIHEMVLLVFGDRFMPVMESMLALAQQQQPVAGIFAQAQMERIRAMYEAGADDPLLITLSVSDEMIELKSKLDTEVYPELLESMGEARPLRWTQMLPENTMSFLTLTFTPEAKQQITDVYLQAIPDEMRTNPGFAQGLQFAKPALDMLGQEVVLAITDLDPIDAPTILLIVEVANPMAAHILLPMVPQIEHDEPYREVQIKAVNFPSPVQIYFVMVGETLVFSNSDIALRGLIDMVKDETTSGLFAALDPPLNPEIPVYQGFLLKPELYTDLIAPLSALSGRQLPAEANDVFTTLNSMFRDIRFFSEMQDSWLVTRISVSRAVNN